MDSTNRRIIEELLDILSQVAEMSENLTSIKEDMPPTATLVFRHIRQTKNEMDGLYRNIANYMNYFIKSSLPADISQKNLDKWVIPIPRKSPPPPKDDSEHSE